ncbi:MAG: FAD-dependent oxidoreductase, partial [Candidatus Cloacimonetes bacterium]|nr:FAD-dependent oxidoreductase [Candidatus Cloacimonadota bacterium]
MKPYQAVIVGGGPGGYTAAIRLAQKGIECVVFEMERLGGICLNWGCIPTKALVRVADLYSEIRECEDFGIKAGSPELDYNKVQARKNQVVDQLVSGLEFIFQKRKIPVIKSKVETITRKDDKYIINTHSQPVSCDFLILATGSQPKELPNLKIDGKKILSSTDILQISDLPKHLVVVGGGVIGCEFASIFGQFGVQVEIVEFLPRLLSTEDEEISKRLTLALRKKGVKIHLNKAVENYRQQDNNITLTLNDGTEIVTERVLLSVGRQPRLEIEFLDCQPALERGFVKTDD